MKEDEDLARELRGAMEDDEEIGEEAPLLQPQESRVSEIANDRPELASVTPPPVLIIACFKLLFCLFISLFCFV